MKSDSIQFNLFTIYLQHHMWCNGVALRSFSLSHLCRTCWVRPLHVVVLPSLASWNVPFFELSRCWKSTASNLLVWWYEQGTFSVGLQWMRPSSSYCTSSESRHLNAQMPFYLLFIYTYHEPFFLEVHSRNCLVCFVVLCSGSTFDNRMIVDFARVHWRF